MNNRKYETLNIIQIAKELGFEFTSVELLDGMTVFRTVGLDNITKLRQVLIDNGYPKPLSCHREDESVEVFMIQWHK